MSIYPNNGPFTDSIESGFYFHLCAYLNWLEFFFNYGPHIIFAQTKLFSKLKNSCCAQEGDDMYMPRASLVSQTGKNPPAMRETWVQPLGWEDPLEEVMATHSSTLAWKIPMDRGA